MLKHIVMWKLKEFAENNHKNENAKKMKEMLESLKNKINEINHIEIGINVFESERAYDVSLYIEFKDKEAHDIYQKHPEHLKVVDFITKIREVSHSVDYYC